MVLVLFFTKCLVFVWSWLNPVSIHFPLHSAARSLDTEVVHATYQQARGRILGGRSEEWDIYIYPILPYISGFLVDWTLVVVSGEWLLVKVCGCYWVKLCGWSRSRPSWVMPEPIAGDQNHAVTFWRIGQMMCFRRPMHPSRHRGRLCEGIGRIWAWGI